MYTCICIKVSVYIVFFYLILFYSKLNYLYIQYVLCPSMKGLELTFQCATLSCKMTNKWPWYLDRKPEKDSRSRKLQKMHELVEKKMFNCPLYRNFNLGLYLNHDHTISFLYVRAVVDQQAAAYSSHTRGQFGNEWKCYMLGSYLIFLYAKHISYC